MNLLKPEHTEGRRAASVGMFDGVHAGHAFLLRCLGDVARERGLRSCAVTFRNHPLSEIRPDAAPRLLSTSGEKLSLLAAAGADDCLLLHFDWQLRSMSSEAFMIMLHDRYGVDALLLGFNNNFGCDRGLSFDDYRAIGERAGVEVLKAPEFRGDGCGVSSSSIRRIVASGDVAQAARLLGRRYTLTGPVVAGKQLGRTIGFPTANILPDCADKLIPGNGVYAARAFAPSGLVFPAMVNIGRRPTVDRPGAPVSIETHLIGFSDDLYSRSVTLEFVEFLRGESRFNSIDALRSQLENDRDATLRQLAMTLG